MQTELALKNDSPQKLIEAAWDLYYWLIYFNAESLNDCFSSKLFNLLLKADASNLKKLKLGYPYHVRVFTEWKKEKPQDFFKKYGINNTTILERI